MQKITVRHQSIEDAVANRRQILIELVLQLGELDRFGRPAGKERLKQLAFVRFQFLPVGGLLAQMEGLLLLGPQTNKVRIFFFVDQDVAADGKVHNRCSAVAHVGRIVHQRARLPRRQAIGGRVLWDDGPQPWVASPGVPQPEHHHEYSRGNGECQLLRKNSATFTAAPGSLTKPLSQPTTTVRPSRKESARRMRNSTALPAT